MNDAGKSGINMGGKVILNLFLTSHEKINFYRFYK